VFNVRKTQVKQSNVPCMTALREVEKKESQENINTVLKELALHSEKIPAEPLNGEWI
jgi:hypothetical protein